MKNSELIIKLLEDPNFLAGVNKSIDITQKTSGENKLGYEAAFEVDYDPILSEFVYPCAIDVGDESRVGFFGGSDRIRVELEKKLGRFPTEKEVENLFYERMLVDDENGVSVSYPDLNGSGFGWGEDLEEEIFNIDELEKFMDFHTHPIDPSFELAHLAYLGAKNIDDIQKIGTFYDQSFPTWGDFEFLKQEGSRFGIVVGAKPTIHGRRSFTIYNGETTPLEEVTTNHLFTGRLGNPGSNIVRGIYQDGKFIFRDETLSFSDKLDNLEDYITAEKALEVFDE